MSFGAMLSRRFVVVLTLTLLAGCGGGGGGSSSSSNTSTLTPTPTPTPTPIQATPTFADNLNASGATANTTIIGTAPYFSTFLKSGVASAALADNGRALSVWTRAGASAIDGAGFTGAWNQSDAGGTWGTEQVLGAFQGEDIVFGNDPVLVMNASGNAVYKWSQYNLSSPYNFVRFNATTSWQNAGEITLALGFQAPANPTDVRLLADNTFSYSAPSVASGSIYNYKIVRHLLNGTNSTLSTENLGPPTSSYFAANADGSGRFFWVRAGSGSPSTYDIRAAIVDTSTATLVPFTLWSYPDLCSGLIGATSPLSISAVALITSDNAASSSCALHDLELIRLNTFPFITTSKTRVNSANTSIRGFSLLMDQQGNALALWIEQLISSSTPTSPSITTYQLMSSTSLAGGAWTAAQVAIPNLAETGSLHAGSKLSVAMNANGQVVAAIRTSPATTNSTPGPYIAYGRFSFSSGWSNWTRVATMLNLTEPKIAINSSGTGLLVYSATPTTRSGLVYTQTANFLNIYALRL